MGRKPKVVVVGGAISGPAAHLAFEAAGCEVHTVEARDEVTTTSAGVLGLSVKILAALDDLGVSPEDVVRVADRASTRYTVRGRQIIGAAPGRGVAKATWSVLHGALGQHCTIAYGERCDEPPDADLVVWADGIGSRGRRRLDPGREFRYAGYTVFRGISDVTPASWDWETFVEEGQFLCNVVPTFLPDGEPRVEWNLFLPWPHEFTRHVPQICPQRTEIQMRALAQQVLPYAQMRLVDATTSPISATSIGDWDRPLSAVYGNEVLIGDALASQRPHTAMGANLGIAGGLSLARAYTAGQLDAWESSMLRLVHATQDRGESLGASYNLALCPEHQAGRDAASAIADAAMASLI